MTATPNAGLTADYIINGLPLNFVTGLIYNPSGGAGTATGANITAASTSGRLQIDSAINFGVDTSLSARSNNTNGAEMFFGGAITGSGNLDILAISTGSLFVFTSAKNTYTGSITVQDATIVYLGSTNTFGRQTAITLNGGTASVTSGTTSAAGYGVGEVGYNMQLGSIGGALGGQFSVGTNNGVSTVLAGFNNTTTTFGGAGLAGFNSGSHFAKVGTGSMTQTKASAATTPRSLSVKARLIIAEDGVLVNSLPSPGALTVYTGRQIAQTTSSIRP